MQRLKISLNGTVQGVGFRPFVFRIANDLNLNGFVLNDTTGVIIEVEGEKESLDLFLKKLHTEKPPIAHIYYEELEYLPPSGYNGFRIKESSSEHPPEVFILPDIATCIDCERELLDPTDRRYRYPFINCTNCGPRFTIIKKLPYDRPNTTMSGFKMCSDCEKEYNNPLNRRFHAQPNACDICGPEVFLTDRDGTVISKKDKAISDTTRLLSEGNIIALKGIGGFHLICNALNDEVVNRLRQRKKRSQKPFAVMFRDLDMIRKFAEPTVLEESIILSPARPIVLVNRRGSLLEATSPGLKKIGVFLPYSPLHILLLNSIDFPIVATSGNLSDEPIAKENDEGLKRLKGLSDFFLLHNRPIERRCDDSVVKEVGGFPQIIRRSRGYVPLPIKLPFKLKRSVLGVGGHEKNTISIGFDDRIITSQHIGDMETPESIDNFETIINDLFNIYRFEPEIVVHDLHPAYITTKWTRKRFLDKALGVQHHHAHILSCMAEHGITRRVTGISWDGTGYGTDGTLWGGEILSVGFDGFDRLFHSRHIRLIGGEKAVREPRRVALSILFELFGKDIPNGFESILSGFSASEIEILYSAFKKGLQSPLSSSVGRLFDAVSSFYDVIQICNYEAQSAMMIEDIYDPSVKERFDYEIKGEVIDWEGIFHGIIKEKNRVRGISMFINTLSEVGLEAAKRAGNEVVCLSGGVFQNAPLSSRMIGLLEENGFNVFINRNIPVNDGGLSVGQVLYGGMIEV